MNELVRACVRYRSLLAFVLVLLSVCTSGPLALAQTPTEKAWTVLNAGLASKKTEDRAVAVRALGLLQNDQQALQLAVKALSDHKRQVRTAAADAIGEMQAKSAATKLGEVIVGDEKDVRVVLACANSMIKLGDDRGYGVYYAVLSGEKKKGGALQGAQKKMLQQLFQDPKKMAIGLLPFGGLAYGAYQNLHQDEESPVRAAAAKMLANDPDTKTEAALVTAASDKSWAVRMAALESLAHRDDPKVIPEIEAKLEDHKQAVRYTAAGAVIRLRSLQVAAHR